MSTEAELQRKVCDRLEELGWAYDGPHKRVDEVFVNRTIDTLIALNLNQSLRGAPLTRSERERVAIRLKAIAPGSVGSFTDLRQGIDLQRDNVNVEKVLVREGFTPFVEVPNYWYDASMEEGFDCPECGNPLCCCSAVMFLLA